jgi:co-chaperonin GroES (HSP10)
VLASAGDFPKHGHSTERHDMKKTAKTKGDHAFLRPIGDDVLVLFPNGDWEADPDSGFVRFTGICGEGHRMDGTVVATNRHTPDDICVGTTVYGEPTKGRIVRIDGTTFHLMRHQDLVARAEWAGGEGE